MFRLGVLQFAPAFGEVEANLARVENIFASYEKADVIVMPELFSTGYQFTSREEARSLAEPVRGGRTVERLLQISKRRGGVLVAGVAELDGNEIYNSAVAVSPDGVLARYRKIHLFAEEKFWFSPGDLEFPVFEWKGARVGIMICFDWRFPEAARTLALRGADIIAHPSNLIRPQCPDAMLTRSLENRVFSATANRFGAEARGGKEILRFTGKSQIVSPRGERLLAMGEEEEGLRVCEIDVALARDKKITPFNDALGDRRPAFYEK